MMKGLRVFYSGGRADPRSWPMAVRWTGAVLLGTAILTAGWTLGGPRPRVTLPEPLPEVRTEGVREDEDRAVFTLIARTVFDEPGACVVFPVIKGLVSPELDVMVNERLESDLGLGEMRIFVEGREEGWQLDFGFSAERIGNVAHIRAVREMYLGGAHGDIEKTDVYLDTRYGAFYRMDDLFLEPGTARAALEAAIGEAMARDAGSFFPDAHAAPLPSLFSIAPEGLVITYPPGVIAAQAEGFIDFLIPASRVMPLVNRSGAFYRALLGE